MKSLLLQFAFIASMGALSAAAFSCPPEFHIGMTYKEVQAGPCPDIEKQAFDRKGELVSYFCPSQHVAVLGSVVSGKMVGFVLVDFDPRQK